MHRALRRVGPEAVGLIDPGAQRSRDRDGTGSEGAKTGALVGAEPFIA